MTTPTITQLSDATFPAEIEHYDGVAVVDFFADWCGPCHMVAPILEELAAEHVGKVKVAKLDVEANLATARRYGVRSIPTLLFFRDGKPVDEVIGAVPRAVLAERFEALAA